MKFLVLLALVAVCLPAIANAFECNGCDLDGAWRAYVDYINNDDESINQEFDGQVRWRDEWAEFMTDFAAYQSCLNSEESSCSTEQNRARQSCKEARPDFVYNFRWEREIEDNDYEVRYYLHRGFVPNDDVWDRYCRIRVGDSSTSGTSRVMVQLQGSQSSSLNGAIGWLSQGRIDRVSSATNCESIFRPTFIRQRCLEKNKDKEFPTEFYCANNYLIPQNEAAGNPVPPTHLYGGAHSHARWGCDQYTWDSDSNDDQIDYQCNRLYFVNKYDSQQQFEIGQLIRGAGGPPILETNIETPSNPEDSSELLCEIRVRGTGWDPEADVDSHPCQ